MAAELDFQAIVDLVGDKLREVFDTGDIGISLVRPRDQSAPPAIHIRTRRAHRRDATGLACSRRPVGNDASEHASRSFSTHAPSRTRPA